MERDMTFRYNYSAKVNQEVLEIRNKYLPPCESKLDELKRLDSLVQSSGMIESLCAGVGGMLVSGIGFCLATQVIGSGVLSTIAGVLTGLVGIAAITVAYPLHRMIHNKTKAKYTPRILELTAELTNDVYNAP